MVPEQTKCVNKDVCVPTFQFLTCYKISAFWLCRRPSTMQPWLSQHTYPISSQKLLMEICCTASELHSRPPKSESSPGRCTGHHALLKMELWWWLALKQWFMVSIFWALSPDFHKAGRRLICSQVATTLGATEDITKSICYGHTVLHHAMIPGKCYFMPAYHVVPVNVIPKGTQMLALCYSGLCFLVQAHCSYMLWCLYRASYSCHVYVYLCFGYHLSIQITCSWGKKTMLIIDVHAWSMPMSSQ